MKILFNNVEYEAVINEYGHLTSLDGKKLFARKDGVLLSGCTEIKE